MNVERSDITGNIYSAETPISGTFQPSHSGAMKLGRPLSSAAEPNPAAEQRGIPNQPKWQMDKPDLQTLES